MPGKKSPTFTQVELEFMQILWDNGPLTTESIQKILKEQDRDLADGSIRKVLSILKRKGYLTRRKDGRGYIYQASVVREQAHKNMIQDLLQRAFAGSVPSMVATLLDSREVNEKDLKLIKKMISDYEEGK